jgi:hypothetical protein
MTPLTTAHIWAASDHWSTAARCDQITPFIYLWQVSNEAAGVHRQQHVERKQCDPRDNVGERIADNNGGDYG